MYEHIILQLANKASREKAAILSRFFKTGKGEYGEGDMFIGVTVPEIRKTAHGHAEASQADLRRLLGSPIHEHRLCALLILVRQFARNRKSPDRQKAILDFYLSNTPHINNWDLVDLSAPKILGEWMLSNPEPKLLERLSQSDSLWEQRIAIVATYTMIKAGVLAPTLSLAEGYLPHPHQLMHKATGWMLREVGKKHLPALLEFLDSHAAEMPRTALRYAIERLEPELRRHYMSVKPVKPKKFGQRI